MEGWVFFLILVIGAFLFSFFGVVVLLSRTRRQGEEIQKLKAAVGRLRERYEKPDEVFAAGVFPGEAPESEISPERPPEDAIIPAPLRDFPAEELNNAAPFNGAEQSPGETLPAEYIAAEEFPSSEAAPGNAETSPSEKSAVLKEQSRLEKTLSSFIRGGGLWAAGGVVLLTVAFGALIAYLGRRGFFTVEMGVAAAAAAGLGMILLGWRFRRKRPGYFLILQGGGLGILYLSVFAAHKLTPYFGAPLSLLLMSLLIPPAVILALFQNSCLLAILGFAGGFAAPLLLSGGGGNHLFLFSYCLVLNCGVFAIGFFRVWKSLDLLAFFMTFVPALSWALNLYRPEFFPGTEPFFAAFFILFTLMGLRSLGKTEGPGRQRGDIFLLLGTPAASAALHWKVFSFVPHGYAIVAVLFSAFYLLLTVLILKKFPARRIYAEAYLAFGTLLANIVIPLELSPRLGAALWAAEGAVLFFFGLRAAPKTWKGESRADDVSGRRGDPRIITAGIVTHLVAALAFVHDFSLSHRAPEFAPWRSPAFSGTLIIAVSALAMAVMARKLSPGKAGEKRNPLPFFAALWGFAWWFGGWYFEFRRVLPEPEYAFFIFTSITALFSWLAAAMFRDLSILHTGMIPAPAVALFTILGVFAERLGEYLFREPELIFSYNFLSPSRAPGWLIFFALEGFILLFSKLRGQKGSGEVPWFRNTRRFTVILLALAVTGASGRFITTEQGLSASWTSLAGLLPFFIVLIGIPLLRKPGVPAIARHGSGRTDKLLFPVLPWILSGVLLLWFTVTLFMRGDPSPLPFYIPLLNPLDLLEGLCAAAVIFWQLKRDGEAGEKGKFPGKVKIAVLGDVLVFLWLIAILGRSVHFYGGIPWNRVPGSDAFQFCLFVCWALCGITHIVLGHRSGKRLPWIGGAVLIVFDIAKLILLDMEDLGAIPRILSLFAAGLALLFIGWAAPLPPPPGKKAGNGTRGKPKLSGGKTELSEGNN